MTSKKKRYAQPAAAPATPTRSTTTTREWVIRGIGALAVVQIYAWQSGWWISSLYCILAIILPLMLVLRQLYRASTPADYHRISTWIKWIMLAGILSMLFFRMLPS